LEILFDARYEIVKILEEPNNSGVDPVRILFLDTWRSISPVIRQLFERQNDQVFAMHLVSFVTANDALASIDQYGPELGLDISVDGLRRLARLLNNDPALEPLQLDNKMDPELRKFFGIPAVDEKSQNEMNMLWLDYFVTPAFASGKLPRKLTSKLNNWVPKKREISQYLPMVKKVLTAVGQSQLRRKKLNRKFRRVYQNLVYAAAWQESCWKQFVAVKGFRKPMRSRSGDLGLMQINPRVWRGFYDMHKIKWDIVYNANAGAEILMHYLTRYVIKNKEHIKTGKIDNLARAAYSGYNGGPRQYTRYRKMKIPRKLKRIDQAFYKKYRAVRDRGPLAVKSCYTGI
ncbi:MAG TPA: lytic transglycosylase domain-containing protein, partial [Gammaproteobacteria bacterium]|nr:lytic transglycosylase domain-containing protein [Gammaproteobacteria bacterium]